MTPQDVRALFPALKKYTWLNAAASSPLCDPVAGAIRENLEDSLMQGDLAFPKWLAFKESLRARMATFLGAQTSEFAFTPSTSFGFHVAGSMLKARGVREVLTLEGEFPSTTIPLLNLGLTLQVVKARPDGTFPLEAIERALTPNTGAVAVSVVQFASGFRVDLEGLSALCKARGLPLALNAAQAIGQVPLNFAKLGAAFLCATSYKWFMGGYGVGFLCVHQNWLNETPVPYGSWLSVPPEQLWKAFPQREGETTESFRALGVQFRKEASAVEGSGGVWSSYAGVDAALKLHETVGVGTTLEHNQRLQLLLRAGLRKRGFVPNIPDDVKTLSGICGVPVAGDVTEVVRALVREGIVTTPRGGGLRISTHVYNREEDVGRVLAAVDRLGVKPG